MSRLIGLLLIVASMLVGWGWLQYQAFLTTPLIILGDGQIIDVPRGASLGTVARDLQQAGVLRDARYLHWYGRYTGQARSIRAGEYRLTPDMTPDALLALLVSGRTVQHGMTLLEGWNIRQLRAALAANDVLVQTLEAVDDAEMMQRLGLPGEHPEGRFFPDTYFFERGTSDIDLLRRAQRRMAEELAAAWDARAADLPLKDAYQALIMASIVERETGQAGERREVSGVFARRLRLGMKLQTDPTVIYGMGERYAGRIRRKDLQEDTPYNTYVHFGLPPTPICMPGRAALRAAVDPADGDALYFVSRGDGSHQFSRTLQEHNAAVRKYILKK